MIRVSPLHWYFREEHLQHVMGEMLKRGSPILRGYFDGEEWFLKEGTHRIRAASILKFEPTLIPVSWGRTQGALVRAKYHAKKHGIWFPSVKSSKADERRLSLPGGEKCPIDRTLFGTRGRVPG